MKKDLSAVIFCHIVLTTITLLLLFFPLGTGMFFGSEGDWYSQHVGIAESLRQTMLETGSLIPQYIHLGGGSSIYDFAYYGVLRPDILFSCLVPEIEMKYIIAGYAALGVTASVNFCYIWLRKQKLLNSFAFAGAVLLASAACFYHAHHQIMFVNYMPFLILALMGVDRLLDKKRIALLVFSLFMIYIHSFYYSISCIFVIGIYMLHKCLQKEKMEIGKGKWKQWIMKTGAFWGLFVFTVLLSIGMAMVLLFPTGLDILSNEKDSGSFVTAPVKLTDWSLTGLLYNPYGCGMTLLILYCLLLSITSKRKRFLSVALLLCILFPAISYVLNGFLYSRAKILIPFTSLFVLVAADTLQELYQGTKRYAFLPLLCCFIPIFHSRWEPLILIDGLLLLLWNLLQRTSWIGERIRKHTFWLVLALPVLVSLGINMSDSYLKPVCTRLGIGTNGTYLKAGDNRQEHFTKEEIAEFVTDSRYRFDILANNFVNCNLLADGKINKTSMYSSVTNTDYARFYYDTMHNPISLNNRVALVPGKNECFSYFMGLKYLLTDKENLPAGYKKIIQKGNYILAQNDNVLPVCYGTGEVMKQEDYNRLEFPDTMEALCSKAVVPADDVIATAGLSQGKKPFVSHMKKEKLDDFFLEDGEEILLHPSGKKECYKLKLANPIYKKVLIMKFHVESTDGKEVVISINGIKNKLSSKGAPYPNHNHDFTYLISAKEELEQLEIEVSKGKYTVDNIRIYTADIKRMYHSNIVIPQVKGQPAKKEGNVFEGEINMNESGYFITSYPYRKGYKIKVDGVFIPPRKVNTAFIGFPIGAGNHRIEITFESPGFRAGYMISMISCMLFVLVTVWERNYSVSGFRIHSDFSKRYCLNIKN